MLKTRYFLAFSIIAIGLWLPLASQAFVARSGTDVRFGSNDKMSGTTYAAGERVTIDTPLPGDLICAGQTVVINQPVNGDIICAAQDLTIKSDVSGSVRLVGSRVNLNSKVGRNAMLFGSDVMIDNQTEIKGETLTASQFLESRGQYGQTFHGAASQAQLYGLYSGPINLTMASGDTESLLKINQGAKLDQGLVYVSKNSAEIDSAAQIKGEVVKKDFPINQHQKKDTAMGWLWAKFLRLFMLLATGLVIVSLWPKMPQVLAQTASQKPVKLALIGLLTLIVTPIIVLILAVTIIGLPVALILLVAWLILLYLSKLVIGYWLGAKILPNTKNNLWPFLLGTVILFAVTCIPVLGWVIGAIATWWGLGTIWQAIKK